MPVLKSKKNPFGPDQTVRATRTFACEQGTVRKGERYRGSDPIVQENWSAFVDGDTLDSELENEWESLPAPPEYPSPIITGTAIAPHRQVRSTVDVFMPMPWAPGSEGSRRRVPPPFGGALTRGKILDILDPIVVEHPSWFETITRELTPEDVARAQRLKGLEHEPAA